MIHRERARDAACVLLLIAIAGALFADVLFGGSGFAQRDLFGNHYAFKYTVRETVARGGFPFWNRFISGGQPLAANPEYELFYPPQWLIFARSYRFGFHLHILVHVAIALAGMFGLLRALRISRAAAVFGALSFGLGSFLLGAMPVLPPFFVWSWAPLCFLVVLRALERPSARRMATAALVAAMQLVVFEAVSILAVWLLVIAGAVFWCSQTQREAPPAFRTIALIAAAAALIAAVVIVPAIDHARDSIRSRGITFANAADFSMTPTRPMELLVPHLFGASDPMKDAFWATVLFRRGLPFFGSIFCGFAVTIFLLAGVLSRTRGWIFVVSTTAIAWVLAIGEHFPPLFHALYSMGFFKSLRYPEKFFAVAVIVIVVFAAAVADRFLAGEVTRPVMLAAGIVAAANAALAIVTFAPAFPRLFASVWGAEQIGKAVAAHSLWTFDALLAIAWLAFLAAGRVRRPRAWLLAGLCLLVLDLGRAANDVASRVPPSFFTLPPAEAALRPDSNVYSVFHRGDWTFTAARGMQMAALPSLWLSRDALMPYTPVLGNHYSTLEADWGETALLPTHALLDELRSLAKVTPRWSTAIMTLANVGKVIDYRRPVGPESLESAVPVAIGDFRWRQPRYFFATSLVPIADFTTCVQTNPAPMATAFIDGPAARAAAGRVLAASESPNGAVLDVDASGPAFLVMTVTRHKYWQITIDGRPVPVVAANFAYQGVQVPEGRHRVIMRYRNPLVIASGVVSLVALLAAAVALAYGGSTAR